MRRPAPTAIRFAFHIKGKTRRLPYIVDQPFSELAAMQSSRRTFLKSTLAGGAATLAGCAPPARRSAAPSISALDRFRNRFDGVALAVDEPQYEAWRRGVVWQMDVPNRRPELIVRPRTVEAAAAALAYAREARMKVCVKSGGHNVSGAFIRSSGMLLDLAEFGRIVTSVETSSAWVQPAAWSWNLAKTIDPLGFGFPYAHCATVPMGGYLLGGGVGINGDAWGGIACHSVEALRIMLATGEIVEADANKNADLYWAARGGGTGFFGAVIDFRLNLHPAAADIKERVILYPIDAAREVAQWLERISENCPKEIELMMMLAHRPPPLAGQTKRERTMCLARLAAFGTRNKSAERIMSEIGGVAPPSGAFFSAPDRDVTMTEVMIGSVNPAMGLGFGRYNVDTIWTDSLGEAIAPLIDLFVESPSPKSHILATPRHGASLKQDAAFSSLGKSFVGIYSVWDSEADDEANIRSTNELSAAMSAAANGRYINETDGFSFPEKIAACFSPTALTRLNALRDQYDETGVFHGFPGG